MFKIQMLVILILVVFVIPTQAQDDSSRAYQFALQQIEAAVATNAIELRLEGLKLAELPPEIGQLSNLAELWLSSNNLTSLPPEIGNLENLGLLALSGNELTELPPEIGRLQRLRGLSVSSNQLSDLPSEIAQLSNLEFLDISNNNFRQLPPVIGQLSKLNTLLAMQNQLSMLPNEILNLTNLQSLHLEHNEFRHLSNVFLQLELPPPGNTVVFSYSSNGWGTYSGVHLQNNPLVSPPPEVANQGLAAIQSYLRNQQRHQIQQILLWVASGVTLCVGFVLAFRLKTRGGRKPKKKRG